MADQGLGEERPSGAECGVMTGVCRGKLVVDADATYCDLYGDPCIDFSAFGGTSGLLSTSCRSLEVDDCRVRVAWGEGITSGASDLGDSGWRGDDDLGLELSG